MRFPSKETVERLRREFPIGTRVKLVKMDDVQAPPIGTHGTVIGVDDAGSIMVAWDNGSGLSVAYGEDVCRKIREGGAVMPNEFLEDLYFGRISPWDSRETITPEMQEVQKRIQDAVQKLEERLSEDNILLLESILSDYGDYEGLADCRAFKDGFRLGVKCAMDTFRPLRRS